MNAALSTLGSISAASSLPLKFTPYLFSFVITYRIYSNRRRAVYFIFAIHLRRLFEDGVYSGAAFIQKHFIQY